MTDVFYESESLTISLLRTMPLAKKISEVSKQISKWLHSLEKPLNHKTLRLRRIEKTDKEYIYHYEIHRKVIEEKTPNWGDIRWQKN